jgi:hypothetical protein
MRTRAAEREAAANGATLLDERMPGWHDKIDLDRLDLASEKTCVLGQLFPVKITTQRWRDYGFATLDAAVSSERDYHSDPVAFMSEKVCVANYAAGKVVLLAGETPSDYGFDVNDYSGARATRYGGLDAAWAEEVKKRQAT